MPLKKHVRLETKTKNLVKKINYNGQVWLMLDLKNKRDKIIIVPKKYFFSNPVICRLRNIVIYV